MKQTVKKLLSLLAAMAMVVTLIPVFAAAQTTVAGPDQILSMCNPIGRLTKYNDTLLMETSASNFTLCGQLQGDIVMDVTVEAFFSEYHNLFVEVDGKM